MIEQLAQRNAGFNSKGGKEFASHVIERQRTPLDQPQRERRGVRLGDAARLENCVGPDRGAIVGDAAGARDSAAVRQDYGGLGAGDSERVAPRFHRVLPGIAGADRRGAEQSKV
jgi:hypothetical protein